MGGGKDQKDANQMIKSSAATAAGQAAAFDTRNQADLVSSQAKGNDLYGSLTGGYGAMTQAGREAPITPTGGVGGGGGGGGASGVPGSNATFNEASNSYRDFMNKGGGISGASNKQLDDSEGSYRNFMSTGGWDPNRVKSMDENIQGLKGFGKTGGLTDADVSRMQGGGVYDEFAKTGGYSAGDIANIRSRATSTIPQFYQNMKDQASQAAATQGSYGPGQSALMARFGRGQAAAGADASLNAELGIKDKVNTGRLAGAGGMASTGRDIASLRTGNQLAGITGAGGMEQGLQESIRAGQEYGTTGLQSIGQNQREADMRAAEDNANYRLQGTQGIDSMAQADRDAAFKAQALGQSGASLGLQSAYQQQQQANWAAQFQQSQKEFGLTGLNSLYSGGGPGEYMADKGMALNSMNAGSQNAAQSATALKQGNQHVDWTKIAAMSAAGIGTAMTGGALAPSLIAASQMGGS